VDQSHRRFTTVSDGVSKRFPRATLAHQGRDFFQHVSCLFHCLVDGERWPSDREYFLRLFGGSLDRDRDGFRTEASGGQQDDDPIRELACHRRLGDARGDEHVRVPHSDDSVEKED